MTEFSVWEPAAPPPAAASNDVWAASLGARSAVRHRPPRAASDPRVDLALNLPASPRFWLRGGAGRPILVWLALAHTAAGLFSAIAGALVWYFVEPRQMQPIGGAVAGLGVALAGAAAAAMARSIRPEVALAARILLPAADLFACAVVLWLLGNVGFAPLLFAIPITVAALLLSWRGGATLAALAVLTFAAIGALRLGSMLDVWVPQTLALACVSTLLAICAGVYTGQITESITAILDRAGRLRDERDRQAAEQQRLLEGLNLLEETQARLERERAAFNVQMNELAAIAARLAQGDRAAAHALHTGMYGPLDVLAGALIRMSQQMSTAQDVRHDVHGYQRALETIAAAVREQSHLLVATDGAVGELSSSANQLVAEVRLLARGSGELPGLDRHVLFQAMRDVERHVIAQANDAAMVGARVAQLRGRQADLEAEVLRVAQGQMVPQSGDLVNRPDPATFAVSTPAVRRPDSAVLPPIPVWEPPAE